MNISVTNASTLPSLIDRASKTLQSARSAAEILEARDMAGVAYDAAKKAARFAIAKKAGDEVIVAAHRTQADALDIEAGAKRRLADEYDAAQERDELQQHGGQGKRDIPDQNIPSAKDAGLTPKAIHEARIIRDAEEEEPGIIRRALDQMLEAGESPERSKINRIAKSKRKRTRGARFAPPVESQHDRDLRALIGVWESACESARAEFLETVN